MYYYTFEPMLYEFYYYYIIYLNVVQHIVILSSTSGYIPLSELDVLNLKLMHYFIANLILVHTFF